MKMFLFHPSLLLYHQSEAGKVQIEMLLKLVIRLNMHQKKTMLLESKSNVRCLNKKMNIFLKIYL